MDVSQQSAANRNLGRPVLVSGKRPAPVGDGMEARSIRAVIFASSLGTVFEW
jgi:hypothetical protein